jgi:hypothetical protein
MTHSRPFGVTLLAVLAALAAIVAAIHALQFLHLLPFFLGPMAFFGFDLFAALLWALNAVIYVWVAKLLWELNPQGWLFVVIVAGLNLLFDLIAVIGASSFAALLPSFIVNAVILVYCLWPRTREAFAHA